MFFLFCLLDSRLGEGFQYRYDTIFAVNQVCETQTTSDSYYVSLSTLFTCIDCELNEPQFL